MEALYTSMDQTNGIKIIKKIGRRLLIFKYNKPRAVNDLA